MKFISWPASNPEIAVLSARQREEAWRNAQGHMYSHWETWVGLLAVVLLTVAGRHVGAAFGGATFGPEAIGAMAGAGVGGLAYSRARSYVAFRYYSEAQRAGGVA